MDPMSTLTAVYIPERINGGELHVIGGIGGNNSIKDCHLIYSLNDLLGNNYS